MFISIDYKMSECNKSETIPENIFRSFYGAETFIEKSAIPKTCWFTSKKGTNYKWYPDFFLDLDEYAIIVEAKSTKHIDAENEVQFYMSNNKIKKDLIGIAISWQESDNILVTYYYKLLDGDELKKFDVKNTMLSLNSIKREFNKTKYGEIISTENLLLVLKNLNKKFNNENKIRDTDRSLFFSWLMIALKDNNFRSTYKNIQAPSKEEMSTTKAIILEAHNLNVAILNAITKQLESKINNLSKEYSWQDKFSFIKNIDFPLSEYKEIIETIETKIFAPFVNEEKQDILGRAYKIFLSRAWNVDNKNIILTPDHIKSLMVKLARLNVDDVVLDTCTGSGGFLMEAMETMINDANRNEKIIKNIKEKQLIWFEVDPVLFALACSNMFLHWDWRTNLLFRSSLLKLNDGKDKVLFNYIKWLKPTKVMINPPYENNNSIKFVKQALDYLENNGKLIIIMPTPTLTRNQWGATEEILRMAKLDFVIKMPMNLFSEQKRCVNTSIFWFTKTPHNKEDEVMFYNLEDDGFISIQHKWKVDKYKRWDSTENKIVNAIFNSKEIEGVSKKKKIYKNWILNCWWFEEKRNSNYEIVKMWTIFNLDEKGTLASDDADENGEYDFITASEEWKKHSEYTNDEEAIVYAVSAGGSLWRANYVNWKFIASNLCLVITPKENSWYKINLEYYAYYLNAIRKKLVPDIADGTSKLTLSPKDLKNYYIDYIPYEIQIDFVNTNIKELKEAKKKYFKEEEKLINKMNELF